MRHDGLSMSPELIGWSWLYHHYVRIDLNIQAQAFCDVLHIDERTLRRYQQHSLKRLTNILIQREWSARLRQRNRRLFSELPHAGNFNPLAMHTDANNYVSRMFGEAKPCHFCISGSRGIGKQHLWNKLFTIKYNKELSINLFGFQCRFQRYMFIINSCLNG